jgi:hypothetical protein
MQLAYPGYQDILGQSGIWVLDFEKGKLNAAV